MTASVFSQGFVHADEHQQYLEVAQGIVYGPWVKFWEHERGVRNYLYPGCLALLLWLLEKVGISDPVHQETATRALMSLSVFASISLLARDWLRQGRFAAAFCLLSLAALSPDVIYMSIRTLSETAAMIPLALSMYFFQRRPFLTGLLLGTMFAVRFQTAFFTLGFLALSLYDDWSAAKWTNGATWKITAGLILSLSLMGFIDRVTWGRWFHSPIEAFRANITEGVAASFGTSRWDKHLEWTALLFAEAVPLFGFILLVLGLFYERRFALVASIFLFGHSAIGHKEYRFLWPILPIGLAVFSAGFESACAFLRSRFWKAAFVALLTCCLVKGSWSRLGHLDWNPEPSRASSLALAKVGRRADVTGVAVYNIPSAACGNYFYLRRNVPLVFQYGDDPSVLTCEPLWPQGKINYVIARTEDATLFLEMQLEEMDIVHDLGIYRLASSHSR
ncbi:MAG TPA: hypothetical protein VMF69_01525 [Gemmataceae bacterium]|nr:hypothetical protein [Gemmataceae bacterium]